MTTEEPSPGYGRPPKRTQWKKGQSGNRAGRPPKPPPTWAQIIEKEWMIVLELANGQKTTALELMLLHVNNGLRLGDRCALRCRSKFETMFRRKLQLAYKKDPGGRQRPGGRHKVYRPAPDEPLSEKEKKYRAWQEEIEVILPKNMPLSLLPKAEAAKLFALLKRAPEYPMSRDAWCKPRSKKLADTEIFEQVLNAPVVLQQAGRSIRVPRMDGTIKQLVADGAKGILKSVEILLDLHRKSTKDGDFGIPKKVQK